MSNEEAQNWGMLIFGGFVCLILLIVIIMTMVETYRSEKQLDKIRDAFYKSQGYKW